MHVRTGSSRMDNAHATSGRRVLIVDDDPDLIDLLTDGLQLVGGYEVVVAPDGANGLEAFMQARPDCVVVDVRMPGLNGYQFVRALRGDPATAQAAIGVMQLRLPSVVVTELDLPDQSGVELLAHNHNTSTTHNVLLMVVTGRASVRDKIAAFQAGADDYLVKPVDPQQFETHIYLMSRFRSVIPN